MKLIYTYLSSIFLSLALFACDKDLEYDEQLKPQLPVSTDQQAGSWQMIVLTGPQQIVVPAPEAMGSAAYQAELEVVKKAQASLTKEQENIIAYWSVGGVIRWNQFMRELVARYNLPPAPLPDGSYPAPDPENPFDDPNFPFANPPYAARAYSYVSVAQYEALKVAWHYKYLYNRSAPHQLDPAIRRLGAGADLPAYPSEDAVLSGVSAEMLKAMFPAALKEITLKAAQQRNAALWAGKAAPSDIKAGTALGKAVVQLMMQRAANDGMSASVGTPADWKKMEDGCLARGEVAWKSLEGPVRPPMLPLFGKVKAWNMSAEEIAEERPGPPPSTSSEKMKQELAEVKWYANNISRERLAIVHRWADGVGTYTPPGHWNDIATEYIHQARYSEVRTARAYALLNMALHDAAVGCWDTKFYYFNPRPSQLDPSIKTTTGVPNFPAYTSGHSTFSAAAATMLAYLFPEQGAHFQALALEAANSRLYGGIHYRADVEVGLVQGQTIGSYTLKFAATDGAN